jgi:hypothetical protein
MAGGSVAILRRIARGRVPSAAKAEPATMRVIRSDASLANLSPESFRFAGAPAMLVIAYVSPHVDFRQVVARLRLLSAPARLIAVTTAGELCDPGDSSGHAPSQLYCSADGDWNNLVVQIFGADLLSAVSVHSVPLANEDIRAGHPQKSIHQRLEEISAHLARVTPPFPIHHEDTLALTLVDGLSASENFFMEAVYQSQRFPCIFIGGSSATETGAKFRRQDGTWLFDGSDFVQHCALVAFVKMQEGARFGIFKTQNVAPVGKSLVVMEGTVETRQVTSVAQEGTVDIVPVIDAMCEMMQCRPHELKARMKHHDFAIIMNGELFVRSASNIDVERGVVTFYCEVNAGDVLHLVRTTDFLRQTRQDLTAFLQGKPDPVGVVLNDCVQRRTKNPERLRDLDGLWGDCGGGLFHLRRIAGHKPQSDADGGGVLPCGAGRGLSRSLYRPLPDLLRRFRTLFRGDAAQPAAAGQCAAPEADRRPHRFRHPRQPPDAGAGSGRQRHR